MYSLKIEFKSPKQEAEYARLLAGDPVFSPMLLPLVLASAAAIRDVTGTAPTITEILRAPKRFGYHSVHELGRGVDFRTWTITPGQIVEICSRVNSSFEYRAGSGRILKALAFHKKGTGDHLHGQVPIGGIWRR